MGSRWNKKPEETKIQEVEQCVRELKVHGLVSNGTSEGTCVITEKAADLINEAARQMRRNFPKASENDVTLRAIIFVVLHELGNADRDFAPVFASVLNTLYQKPPHPR